MAHDENLGGHWCPFLFLYQSHLIPIYGFEAVYPSQPSVAMGYDSVLRRKQMLARPTAGSATREPRFYRRSGGRGRGARERSSMKTYGLRDIIGPIMVGPSSSHTAGALRIASIARKLFGGNPERVTFTL